MKAKYTHRVLAVMTAALWLSSTSAEAAVTDPLIEGAKQCTKALPTYEQQNGIPAHLLSAIATTESGRYHEGLKISIPWPWTINAAGRGYYFDTKAEAIAAARKLMARGIQSIDVGCMQVNLHHHPDAFASLDEAFDPQRNVAYAAGFLRTLYQDSGSWKRAAAEYHSKTPEKGSKYVGRVYDSWSHLVEKLRLAKLTVPNSSLSVMKEMRPTMGAGVKYASAQPKRIKIEPLPEQVGRKVPDHKAPRMNIVTLSSKSPRKESGILVVKPEIQTAAAPMLPDTGILRIDSRAEPSSRKNGPNFIFSD